MSDPIVPKGKRTPIVITPGEVVPTEGLKGIPEIKGAIERGEDGSIIMRPAYNAPIETPEQMEALERARWFHEGEAARQDTPFATHPSQEYYYPDSFDDYRRWLGDIIDAQDLRTRYGGDLRYAAAEAQSSLYLVGAAATQAILGHFVGGTLSALGSILPGGGLYKKIMGEHDDIWGQENLLAQMGSFLHHATMEDWTPIHQTQRAEKGWGLQDRTWWAAQAPSIASSLSLIVPTFGVARGVAYLGKLTRLSAQMGRKARQWSDVVGRSILSRTFYTNTESLDVWRTSLEYAMHEHGMNYSEAVEYASDAASTNFRWGYVNMWQDLIQWGMIIRGNYIASAGGRKALEQYAVKSGQGSNLRVLAGTGDKQLKGLSHTIASATGQTPKQLLTHGFLQGFEEYNIQWQKKEAQRAADRRVGLIDEGQFEGFWDRMEDHTLDRHTWDATFWGFMGGFVFGGASGATQRIINRNTIKKQEQAMQRTIDSAEAFLDNMKAIGDALAKGDRFQARTILDTELFSYLHRAAAEGSLDLQVNSLQELSNMSEEVAQGLDLNLDGEISIEQIRENFREAHERAVKYRDLFNKHMNRIGSHTDRKSTAIASQRVVNEYLLYNAKRELERVERELQTARHEYNETLPEHVTSPDEIMAQVVKLKELDTQRQALNKHLNDLTFLKQQEQYIQENVMSGFQSIITATTQHKRDYTAMNDFIKNVRARLKDLEDTTNVLRANIAEQIKRAKAMSPEQLQVAKAAEEYMGKETIDFIDTPIKDLTELQLAEYAKARARTNLDVWQDIHERFETDTDFRDAWAEARVKHEDDLASRNISSAEISEIADQTLIKDTIDMTGIDPEHVEQVPVTYHGEIQIQYIDKETGENVTDMFKVEKVTGKGLLELRLLKQDPGHEHNNAIAYLNEDSTISFKKQALGGLETKHVAISKMVKVTAAEARHNDLSRAIVNNYNHFVEFHVPALLQNKIVSDGLKHEIDYLESKLQEIHKKHEEALARDGESTVLERKHRIKNSLDEDGKWTVVNYLTVREMEAKIQELREHQEDTGKLIENIQERLDIVAAEKETIQKSLDTSSQEQDVKAVLDLLNKYSDMVTQERDNLTSRYEFNENRAKVAQQLVDNVRRRLMLLNDEMAYLLGIDTKNKNEFQIIEEIQDKITEFFEQKGLNAETFKDSHLKEIFKNVTESKKHIQKLEARRQGVMDKYQALMMEYDAIVSSEEFQALENQYKELESKVKLAEGMKKGFIREFLKLQGIDLVQDNKKVHKEVSKTKRVQNLESTINERYREAIKFAEVYDPAARRPFIDSSSFLIPVSQQDQAPMNDDVARWHTFVQDIAMSKFNKKGKNFQLQTVVWGTMEKEANYVQEGLKFYVGKEQHKLHPEAVDNQGFTTFSKLSKIKESEPQTYNKLEARASQDIKFVVTDNRKNFDTGKRHSRFLLTTKQGDIDTSHKRNYLVFTSMAEATKTFAETGHERFGKESWVKEQAEKLMEKQELSEADAVAQAEKDYTEAFEAARLEHEERRNSLINNPDESMVFTIAATTPGKTTYTPADSKISISETLSQPERRSYVIGRIKKSEIVGDEYEGQPTAYVSGRNVPVTPGVAYILMNNNLVPIQPKTLGETGSVNDIMNIIKYIANRKEGWDTAYDYLLKVLHHNIADESPYRFYFTHAYNFKTGKMDPNKLHALTFGENKFTLEQLARGEGMEELRSFLQDKRWNINKNVADYNKDRVKFEAVVVDNDLNMSTLNFDDYKHFYFSDKGGNVSKAWVNLPKNTDGKFNTFRNIKEDTTPFKYQSLVLQDAKTIKERADKDYETISGTESTGIETVVEVEIHNRDKDVTYSVIFVADVSEDGVKQISTKEDKKGSEKYHNKDEMKFHGNMDRSLDVLVEDLSVPFTKTDKKAVLSRILEMIEEGAYEFIITGESKDMPLSSKKTSVSFTTRILEVKIPVKAEETVDTTKDDSPTDAEQIQPKKATPKEKAAPTTEFDPNFFLFNSLGDVQKEDLKKLARKRLEEDGESDASDSEVTEVAREIWREQHDDAILDRRAKSIETTKGTMLRAEWEARKDFLEKTFPDSEQEAIEGLIDDKAWGRILRSGKILISDLAVEGTIYHEAFHRWNLFFNNEASRQRLYDEVRRSLKKKDLTNEQAEEILAEEFRVYMLSPKDYYFGKSRQETKTVFQKFWSFIKNMFARVFGINLERANPAEIMDAFRVIENGTFYKSEMVSMPYKHYDSTSKLGPIETAAYVDHLNHALFRMIHLSIRTGNDEYRLVEFEKHVDDLYRAIKPQIERSPQKDELANMLNNWDEVVQRHKYHLLAYGINVTSTIEEISSNPIAERLESEEAFVRKDNTQFANASEQSSKERMPKAIRLLLAGIPQSKETKNSRVSKYGTNSTVDFNKVINTINNSLAGSNNMAHMISKIAELATHRHDISYVGRILGILEGEGTNIRVPDDYESNLNKNQLRLLGQLYSTFSNDKQNPMVITRNNDGITVNSNPVGETNRDITINIWQHNAIHGVDKASKNRTKYIYKKGNDYLLNIENLRKTLKDRSRSSTARTIDKNIEFLRDIGINIDKESLETSTQRSALNKLITYMYSELRKPEYNNITISVQDLYDPNLMPFGKELKILAEAMGNEMHNDVDLMYFNQEGNMEWSITLHSDVSHTINKLNFIADFIDEQGGASSGVEGYINNSHPLSRIQPFNGEKGQILSIDSVLWRAMMDGKRIDTGVTKGIQTPLGDGTPISSVEPGDYISMQVDNILNNRTSILRAGERTIDRWIDISGLNIGVVGNIDSVVETYLGYLRSEAMSSIALILESDAVTDVDNTNGAYGSNLEHYKTNARGLRVYSYLTDGTGKNKIQTIEDFLAPYLEVDPDTGKSKTLLMGDETDLDTLSNLTDEYINKHSRTINRLTKEEVRKDYELLKDSLIDNKIVSVKGDNYTIQGLNAETIVNGFMSAISKKAFKATDQINSKVFDNVLFTLLARDFASKQEQLRLFVGDLAIFKSPDMVHKRMSSLTSNKKLTLNEAALLERLDEQYPRVDRQPRAQTIRVHTIPTVTAKSRITGNEINVFDGQAISTLDFIRDFHTRNGEWTTAQERTYQYEMQNFLLKMLKDKKFDKFKKAYPDVINEYHFTEGIFSEHTKGEVPKVPMFRKKPIKINSVDMGPIGPIKPLAVSPLYQTGDLELYVNAKDIVKQSTAPMIPSTFMNSDAKITRFLDMIRNSRDILTDETTHKSTYQLGDTEINFNDYGDQTKVHGEAKGQSTYSTQKRRIEWSDMFEGGKIKSQYKDLAGKKELHDLVISEIYERNLARVQNDLGFTRTVDESGESHYSFETEEDVQKFGNYLKTLFVKRQLPQNAIDGLSQVLDSEQKMFDYLVNAEKLKEVLYRLVDNSVIKVKVPGEMLVQESSFEYAEDLKTYSKGKAAEVMVTLPQHLVDWVESIGGLDVFNQRIADGKVDEKLLTINMNRVPTSDLSSIEVFKVVKFLPHYAGQRAILPYEVVEKSGSDFDIDKMTAYYNNFIVTADGPRYINYLDENSTLTQRAEAFFYDLPSLIDILHMQDKDSVGQIESLVEIASIIKEGIRDLQQEKHDIQYSDEFENTLSHIDQIVAEIQEGKISSLSLAQEQYALLQQELKDLVKDVNYELKIKYKEKAKIVNQIENIIKDLPIHKQNTNKAILNKMYEISSEVVLHPSRFEKLTRPTSAQYIKDMAEKFYTPITNLQKAYGDVSFKNITKLWFDMMQAETFWKSASGIGISAVGVVHHVTSQQKPIEFIDGIPLLFDGQGDGVLRNGVIETTSGENVSDLNHGLVQAFVDAVKDPFIAKLVKSTDVLSTLGFLMRYGNATEAGTSKSVALEQIATMINNRYVQEYLTQKSISSTTYARHNNLKREESNILFPRRREIGDKILSRIKPNYDSVRSLHGLVRELGEVFPGSLRAEGIMRTLQKELAKREKLSIRDIQSKKNQAEVLEHYLYYEELANIATGIATVTRPDAGTGKNDMEISLKLERLQDMLEHPLVNNESLLAHINETFLSLPHQTHLDSLNMYNRFFLSSKNPLLAQFIHSRFIKPLSKQRIRTKEKVKLLKAVENDLLLFMYNSKYAVDGIDITRRQKLRLKELFTGDNSLAKRLPIIIEKHGLQENEFLSVVRGVVNEYSHYEGRHRGYDYLTKFQKRFDVNDQNLFTEYLRELLEHSEVEVTDFAHDLIEGMFLQKGRTPSNINMINIIPNEYFISMLDQAISRIQDPEVHSVPQINSRKMNSYLNTFYDLFYRNNWNNTNLVPRYGRGKVRTKEGKLNVFENSRHSDMPYITIWVPRGSKRKGNVAARSMGETILLKRTSKTVKQKGNEMRVFVEVPKLGDGKRMKEYPFTRDSVTKSFLQANNYDYSGLRLADEAINETVTESQKDIDEITTVTRKKIAAAVRKAAPEKYANKEVIKVNRATQFIGEGTERSNTQKYANIYDRYGLANTGQYTASDVIFVSSNGRRTGRVNPVSEGVLQRAYKNIDLAIEAGASFIMDTASHLEKTGKRYNIGEVQLAEYLESKGYKREGRTGIWNPGRVNPYDILFKDTGIGDSNYQLAQTARNIPGISESLTENLMGFLGSIGVTINNTPVIKNKFGEEVPQAIAVARLANMTIDVIQDKMNRETLPEEAAHFYVHLLDPESSFYRTMYNRITEYAEYSEVKRDYADIYNSESAFRIEAMGKLIGRIMANTHEGNYSARQERQATSWFGKLWQFIKNMFKKATIDPYAIAAREILSSDIARLQLHNMEIDIAGLRPTKSGVKEGSKPATPPKRAGSNMYNKREVINAVVGQYGEYAVETLAKEFSNMPLDEFNTIAEKAGFFNVGKYWTTAPTYTSEVYQLEQIYDQIEGVQKFEHKDMYFKHSLQAETEYLKLVDIFGEEVVSMEPIKGGDNQYTTKIRIQSPYESTMIDIVQQDNRAMENVKELSKSENYVTIDRLVEQFNEFFPQYADQHLSDFEKANFMKAVEQGEFQIVCKF